MRAHPARATVLLVHPYPLVRAGLRALVAAPDIHVVGEAATVSAAVRQARRFSPVLTLIGCYPASTREGLDAVARIKREAPRTSVVLLAGPEQRIDVPVALARGCSGFLSPHASRTQLLRSLRAIVRGDCIVDRKHLTRFRGQLGRRLPKGEGTLAHQLSPRERETLRLIAEGRTNPEIASSLAISLATVKMRVHRIITKLGVSDRTQAAVTAVESGLLGTVDRQSP